MRYMEYLEIKDKLELELESCPPIKWFGINRDFLEIRRAIKRGVEFVETYKNNDIYKHEGFYMPYMGCYYGFETIEHCKARIDAKNVSIPIYKERA